MLNRGVHLLLLACSTNYVVVWLACLPSAPPPHPRRCCTAVLLGQGESSVVRRGRVVETNARARDTAVAAGPGERQMVARCVGTSVAALPSPQPKETAVVRS